MQTAAQKILEDTMCYRNIPVFIYRIIYPSFTTTCSSAAGDKINSYYYNSARRAEDYCRNVLFAQAVNDKQYSPANRPFNSYTFDAVYKITYNTGCITSLYTDTYTYMGGAHGETKRSSDTWDFNTGSKLHLSDVYPLTPASLNKLQVSIGQQIAERLKTNPGSYFDDYQSLLRNTFDVNNYYVRPGGGVIYYQQYDIAPYSTGLPEFHFPAAFR